MGSGRLGMPYSKAGQWNGRVRWLLEHIAQALGVDVGTADAQSFAQATASLSTESSSGSVSAGAMSVSFLAVGGAVTVAGDTLADGDAVTFSVPYPCTLAAISYDPGANDVQIAEVRF